VIIQKNCNKKCMQCTYFRQVIFHTFRERISLLSRSGHPHREPKDGEQWFLSAPIGRNKLNSLMGVMAEKAQLPELQFGNKLTNTSARKKLCKRLPRSNVPDAHLCCVLIYKGISIFLCYCLALWNILFQFDFGASSLDNVWNILITQKNWTPRKVSFWIINWTV